MDKKALILLILILFIAAFFRLWQLDEIPPGLYPDVAINGNEAWESLKTRNFKVFYLENNGREGLFMWLIALSFSIFGVSIWSIKIVAAAIGILTVLGLYLLTKELFNSLTFQHSNTPTIIALLSSFFLATSFWHTNFSRIGFRAILLPFILVFSFYFLFRGFRTKKTHNFIISGLFFGLGFYTYISFRFAILILPAILFPFWFIYKKDYNPPATLPAKGGAPGSKKKFLLFTFYFLLFTFLIALPIGIYFLQNPQDFIGRATPISIFATENPIKEFFKSLILHLAMFNFYGDPNWRHNFSGSPMLPWPLGILFLIGLFYSFFNIYKSAKIPLLRSNGISVTFEILVCWWFVMLLPGILTYEGIPHSLRVIGVMPVVYIFVAIGTDFIYQKIKHSNILKNIGIIFLIFVAFFEFYKYFFVWAKNPEVENAFSKDYVEMGNYLNSLPPTIQKYVIVNQSGVPVPWPDGIPMPAQTVMFIQTTRDKKQETSYLLPEDLDQVKINNKKTVILPMRFDQSLFDELSQRFPKGEIEGKNEFSIYKINF